MDDDSDAHMNMMERSSQRDASPSGMELEPDLTVVPDFDHDDDSVLAPAAFVGDDAAVVRDMDMEYGEETAEMATLDTQDSLEQNDIQMKADLEDAHRPAQEQDTDTTQEATMSVSSILQPDRFDDASESLTDQSQTHAHKTVAQEQEQASHNGHSTDAFTAQTSTTQPGPSEELSSNSGPAITAEQGTSDSTADDVVQQEQSLQTLKVPISSNDTTDEHEAYADAEPTETIAPVPHDADSTHNIAPQLDETSFRRPALQKDYLSHIDVSHGHDPSTIVPHDPVSSSSTPRFAPHVSLIYEKEEYSLFRPSSSPSGDHEQVVFAHPEDSNTALDNDDSLYYSSLEHFINGLHRAFPDLKGDGENEVILDFGILDMQISEDNVYCRQLSLFDLDRIRLGMCQPELDRLQVTVKTGRRFAFRFNELAEHCYRMFAGSEDDSGTVYDEHIEPLAEEANQDGTEYYEYNESEAVEQTNEDPSNVAAAAADYTTGENLEDVDGDDEHDPVATLNEYEDASVEASLQTTEDLIPSQPQNENEEVSADADNDDDAEYTDNVDESGDVHPPSDEPYDDPEFLHDVEQDVESYEDHEEAADESDRTLQETDENDTVQDQTIVEETQIVDPEASVEDAAKQVEEYEENTFDAEEATLAEGQAASMIGEIYSGSNRKVDVNGDDEAGAYYHNLTTPTDEEVVLLEEPSNDASSEQAGSEISKATVFGDGMIEKAIESDTHSLLSSKRSRDDSEYVEDAASIVDESGYHESVNGENNEILAKRPKIAA